jgi:Glycosyl hydrolase catalytic core
MLVRCALIFLFWFLCFHNASAQPKPISFSLDDILTPRRPIPYAYFGINAFANDQRFGTIRSQLREVRSQIKIKPVRILLAWNDQVQSSPSNEPFWGFYDEIINNLPAGSEALVILTGVPSWMSNKDNWIDADPRVTFVERWVKKVVARYARKGRIKAWQIWNEPNNPDFAENETLEVLNSPTNFKSLIEYAYGVIKSITPRRKVLNGATTAIAQNYPSTLNYNKALLDAGILSFVDIYAIHYYGKSAERVIINGGVADLLSNLQKPIWVTEIGEKGVLKQREYAERYLPFLRSKIPAIKRFYWYQFTEATSANSTYGLRNITSGSSVSDLYISLRDRR